MKNDIKIQMPPSLRALSKSCETICEKECCGLGAYHFSPFNIIYHLTRWDASIRENHVATIRADLAELTKTVRNLKGGPAKITLADLNAILTENQMLALIDEIDTAVTAACNIYAVHKDDIDSRYQNYLHRLTSPE